MSKPAYYRCTEHGRIAVRTYGKAAATAPCPTCGQSMPRAPAERGDQRFVALTGATKDRLKAHAKLVGKSMGALVEEATRKLGGAS